MCDVVVLGASRREVKLPRARFFRHLFGGSLALFAYCLCVLFCVRWVPEPLLILCVFGAFYVAAFILSDYSGVVLYSAVLNSSRRGRAQGPANGVVGFRITVRAGARIVPVVSRDETCSILVYEICSFS